MAAAPGRLPSAGAAREVPTLWTVLAVPELAVRIADLCAAEDVVSLLSSCWAARHAAVARHTCLLTHSIYRHGFSLHRGGAGMTYLLGATTLQAEECAAAPPAAVAAGLAPHSAPSSSSSSTAADASHVLRVACEEGGDIDRDVLRTMPSHPFFRVDTALLHFPPAHVLARLSSAHSVAHLRRLLRNFVLRSPDVGYAQGMNYVAAVLLLNAWQQWQVAQEQRSPPHGAAALPAAAEARVCLDEDGTPLHPAVSRALTWMLALARRYACGSLWSPGLPRLHMLSALFARALRSHLPLVHEHFHSVGFQYDALAAQWFLALLATAIPAPSLWLLWHHFALDGWKALLRALIAVLAANAPRLLECDAYALSTFFRLWRDAVSSDASGRGTSAAARELTGAYPAMDIIFSPRLLVHAAAGVKLTRTHLRAAERAAVHDLFVAKCSVLDTVLSERQPSLRDAPRSERDAFDAPLLLPLDMDMPPSPVLSHPSVLAFKATRARAKQRAAAATPSLRRDTSAWSSGSGSGSGGGGVDAAARSSHAPSTPVRTRPAPVAGSHRFLLSASPAPSRPPLARCGASASPPSTPSTPRSTEATGAEAAFTVPSGSSTQASALSPALEEVPHWLPRRAQHASRSAAPGGLHAAASALHITTPASTSRATLSTADGATDGSPCALPGHPTAALDEEQLLLVRKLRESGWLDRYLERCRTVKFGHPPRVLPPPPAAAARAPPPPRAERLPGQLVRTGSRTSVRSLTPRAAAFSLTPTHAQPPVGAACGVAREAAAPVTAAAAECSSARSAPGGGCEAALPPPDARFERLHRSAARLDDVPEFYALLRLCASEVAAIDARHAADSDVIHARLAALRATQAASRREAGALQADAARARARASALQRLCRMAAHVSASDGGADEGGGARAAAAVVRDEAANQLPEYLLHFLPLVEEVRARGGGAAPAAPRSAHLVALEASACAAEGDACAAELRLRACEESVEECSRAYSAAMASLVVIASEARERQAAVWDALWSTLIHTWIAAQRDHA